MVKFKSMVRTRFAPSPTGYLHIGGLRTAAYAYAMAKHDSGQFFLRIEDTDQKREVAGATEKIYETLGKFLTWDDIVVQSDRAKAGAYRDAALKLLKTNHAFYCECPPRNAKSENYTPIFRDPCRDKSLTSGAIKLRIPDNEQINFYDFILKKDVTWDSNKVPDTILLKSDGIFATYHLAVAVDDAFQQISHILRGPEWISSTPIHVLVHQFLDLDFPKIGHLTSILDPGGGKLSKRKGNVSVEQFLADGYLPEALLNFVILLGWAPKDNRELFTLEEFVQYFDTNGFQKSNPTFNTTKLDWFNGHYIRQKSDTELVQLVKPFVKFSLTESQVTQILPLVKDRLIKLSDFDSQTSFFTNPPVYLPDLWPDPAQSRIHLEIARDEFDQLSGASFLNTIKNRGWKVGDFFMSLRIAVCGSRSTPPLTEVFVILGKHESLNRLNNAIKFLSSDG